MKLFSFLSQWLVRRVAEKLGCLDPTNILVRFIYPNQLEVNGISYKLQKSDDPLNGASFSIKSVIISFFPDYLTFVHFHIVSPSFSLNLRDKLKKKHSDIGNHCRKPRKKHHQLKNFFSGTGTEVSVSQLCHIIPQIPHHYPSSYSDFTKTNKKSGCLNVSDSHLGSQTSLHKLSTLEKTNFCEQPHLFFQSRLILFFLRLLLKFFLVSWENFNFECSLHLAQRFCLTFGVCVPAGAVHSFHRLSQDHEKNSVISTTSHTYLSLRNIVIFHKRNKQTFQKISLSEYFKPLNSFIFYERQWQAMIKLQMPPLDSEQMKKLSSQDICSILLAFSSPVINISKHVFIDAIRFLTEMSHFNASSSSKTKDMSKCHPPILVSWSHQLRVRLDFRSDSLLVQQRVKAFKSSTLKECQESQFVTADYDWEKINGNNCEMFSNSLDDVVGELCVSRLYCCFQFSFNNNSYFLKNNTQFKRIQKTPSVSFHSSSIQFQSLELFSSFLTIHFNISQQSSNAPHDTLIGVTSSKSFPENLPSSFLLLKKDHHACMSSKGTENALALHIQNTYKEQDYNTHKELNTTRLEIDCQLQQFHFSITSLDNIIHLLNCIQSSSETCSNSLKTRVSLCEMLQFLWSTLFQKNSLGVSSDFPPNSCMPMLTRVNLLLTDVTMNICTIQQKKVSRLSVHNKRTSNLLTSVLSFQSLSVQNKPFDSTCPSISIVSFDFSFHKFQICMFVNGKSHTRDIYNIKDCNRNKITLLAPLTLRGQIALSFFEFLSKSWINIKSTVALDSCEAYFPTDILRQFHAVFSRPSYHGALAFPPYQFYLSKKIGIHRKKQCENGSSKNLNFLTNLVYPFSKNYSNYLIDHVLYQTRSKRLHDSSAPLSPTKEKKTLFSFFLLLLGKTTCYTLKSAQLTVSIKTLLFCVTKNMSTQRATFHQSIALQPSLVVYYNSLQYELTFSKRTAEDHDNYLLPSRFNCSFNEYFLGVLSSDSCYDAFKQKHSLTRVKLQTLLSVQHPFCTILSPETLVLIVFQIYAPSHIETEMKGKSFQNHQSVDHSCQGPESSFLRLENKTTPGSVLSLRCLTTLHPMFLQPALSLSCSVEKVNHFNSFQVFKLNATLKIRSVACNIEMPAFRRLVELSFSFHRRWRLLCKTWTRANCFMFKPCQKKGDKFLRKANRESLKQIALIPFIFLKIQQSDVNMITSTSSYDLDHHQSSSLESSNGKRLKKFFLSFQNAKRHCDKSDSDLIPLNNNTQTVDSCIFQWKTQSLFVTLKSSFPQAGRNNFVDAHFSRVLPTFFNYQLMYGLKEMKLKLDVEESFCYTNSTLPNSRGPYVSQKCSLFFLVPQNLPYGITCLMTAMKNPRFESSWTDSSLPMSLRLDIALGQMTLQFTKRQFHMLWSLYLDFNTIFLSVFKKETSRRRQRKRTRITKKEFPALLNATENHKIHIVFNCLLNSSLLELQNQNGSVSLSTGKVLLNSTQTYIMNQRTFTVLHYKHKVTQKRSWNINYPRAKVTISIAQTLISCQSVMGGLCQKKYALFYTGRCFVDYSRNHRTNDSLCSLRKNGAQINKDPFKPITLKIIMTRFGGSPAHLSRCPLGQEGVAVYLMPTTIHCFFSVLQVYLNVVCLYTSLLQTKKPFFLGSKRHTPSEDGLATKKTHSEMHVSLAIQSAMIYASTSIPSKNNAYVNSVLCLITQNETEAFFSHAQLAHCQSSTHTLTFLATHNEFWRLTECLHISCNNASRWRNSQKDIHYYRQWKSSLLPKDFRAVLQQETIYAAFTPRLWFASSQGETNFNETNRPLCVAPNFSPSPKILKKIKWGLQVAYENNKSQNMPQPCTHIKMDLPFLCRVNYLKPVWLSLQKLVISLLTCLCQIQTILEKTCDGFSDDPLLTDSPKHGSYLEHAVHSIVEEKKKKKISNNQKSSSLNTPFVMKSSIPSNVVSVENQSSHSHNINQLEKTGTDGFRGDSHYDTVLNEIESSSSSMLLNFYVKIERLCVWIAATKHKHEKCKNGHFTQHNTATGFCIETKVNCHYHCNQAQWLNKVGDCFENFIISPDCYLPHWIVKTPFPVAGSLAISISDCSCYLGDLEFPCGAGREKANFLLIEAFPCSDTFFLTFYKKTHSTHVHQNNNFVRVQRVPTGSSAPSNVIWPFPNCQDTDYTIHDVSMCDLLKEAFETSISFNFNNMYTKASSGLTSRRELTVSLQCSRLSGELTLEDLHSLQTLYETFRLRKPSDTSTLHNFNTKVRGTPQVLPVKQWSTRTKECVVECWLKIIIDYPKGIKLDFIHSNLDVIASLELERMHINFHTTTLLSNEEGKSLGKFLLTMQRTRLVTPHVKKSVALEQHFSSAARKNTVTNCSLFSSDYRLRIVEALYDVVAIVEVPSLTVEINTKPEDTSVASMGFHLDDTLHLNLCPETIQWFKNLQKLCQELSCSQMDDYYITVDQQCFSSWLCDTSGCRLSNKNEMTTINDDKRGPIFEQEKDLSFVLDTLSKSFKGDSVHQAVRIRDLRQLIDTRNHFQHKQFNVTIERECPFKAIEAPNVNGIAKPFISEFFHLSSHDVLLSSFDTFNKIQYTNKLTQLQPTNSKTKYHILLEQFHIQIRNTLNLPLDILVESQRTNLDSNFKSWSFSLDKESSVILPEFACEIHTSVSFRLSNKSNQFWSNQYVLKDLLKSSRYVSFYDLDKTHVTCIVGLFCLNSARSPKEKLSSFNRFHKVFDLRLSAPFVLKNMLPRPLYCTMSQKNVQVQVIVEPFSIASANTFNPTDPILLTQIKFDNHLNKTFHDHFQALHLHPYTGNVNDACPNRLCDCDNHEQFHSTDLTSSENLTALEPYENVSFQITKRVDGSSIDISYTFEALQAQLHISAPYWLVNLTTHRLDYTPIRLNVDEEKTNDCVIDLKYSSFSANQQFLTSDSTMSCMQLSGCSSYTQLSLQDLAEHSLQFPSPIECLKSSSLGLLSTFFNFPFLENPTGKKKSDAKPIASVYPSFCTDFHNAFKILRDVKHFASGRLNHRNNWIMQERRVEEEKLIFDNGQVLILQNHQVSIGSRKVTLLLFLPTHILLNRLPRAFYVRQTFTDKLNQVNDQLVPSGCIKQLQWFTKQDDQHGFQLCDTTMTHWSPLISLGNPQQLIQPLPHFLPFHLSSSSRSPHTSAEENPAILFIHAQLIQGVVVVDISTPYVASVPSDLSESKKRIPKPPLIVQNNLHIPLYMKIVYPVFGSNYITKVSPRTQIPFWIAHTFENSSTLFEISVQSLFFLSQKGSFYSLKEVNKKKWEQFQSTMKETWMVPLRFKPFSFDKEKNFTGILSLHCLNDTTQSFSCICRYAWKLSILFNNNVPTLSIDGVYCFLNTPLHRTPSTHGIHQNLRHFCQGFFHSSSSLCDYHLVTSKFDTFASKQLNKSLVNPKCITSPEFLSQNAFSVFQYFKNVDKDPSLIQYIFSFFPSCTFTLTFFQIAVSVSPVPYEPSRQNHAFIFHNTCNTKTSVFFFVIFSHIHLKIQWRESHSEKNQSLPQDHFLCRLNNTEDNTKVQIFSTLFSLDIIGQNRLFFDSSKSLQYSNWISSKDDIQTNPVSLRFKPHILGRTHAHTKHHEGLHAFSHFLKKKQYAWNKHTYNHDVEYSLSPMVFGQDNVLCLNLEVVLCEKVNVWRRKNYYIQWNMEGSPISRLTTSLLFFDGFNVLHSSLPYALSGDHYQPIVSFNIASLSIQTLPIQFKLNSTWISKCLNEFSFLLKEPVYVQNIDALSCSIETDLESLILKSNFFQINPIKIKLLYTPTWSPILLFKEIKLSPVQLILSIDGVVSLIHLKKASIFVPAKTMNHVTFQLSLDHLVTLIKSLGHDQLAKHWHTILLSLNLSCQPMKHLKMWSQHIKSFFFN